MCLPPPHTHTHTQPPLFKSLISRTPALAISPASIHGAPFLNNAAPSFLFSARTVVEVRTTGSPGLGSSLTAQPARMTAPWMVSHTSVAPRCTGCSSGRPKWCESVISGAGLSATCLAAQRPLTRPLSQVSHGPSTLCTVNGTRAIKNVLTPPIRYVCAKRKDIKKVMW